MYALTDLTASSILWISQLRGRITHPALRTMRNLDNHLPYMDPSNTHNALRMMRNVTTYAGEAVLQTETVGKGGSVRSIACTPVQFSESNAWLDMLAAPDREASYRNHAMQ